jgi:outer membrane lipoprotein carrier protein
VRTKISSIFGWLLLSIVCLGTLAPAEQGNKDLAAILNHFKQVQKSIEDFTADIEQIKVSSLSTEPVIARGKMKFKRPNQVWVEMYPPFPTVTVLNQGVLLIYSPEEKVAQRYQVAGNPTLAKWLLFFQDPIETLGKRISLQEEHEGEVVLSIDPAEDLAIFREIRVSIDTSNWMPKSIELVEKGGNRTTINYYNIKINAGIPDSAFRLRLPPDVDIIEPMRR